MLNDNVSRKILTISNNICWIKYRLICKYMYKLGNDGERRANRFIKYLIKKDYMNSINNSRIYNATIYDYSKYRKLSISNNKYLINNNIYKSIMKKNDYY